jgi:hypothetical protein
MPNSISILYHYLKSKFILRFNFFMAIGISCCIYYLATTNQNDTNVTYPLILAMCKLAFFALLSLTILSLISVIVSYIYLKNVTKINNHNIELSIKEKNINQTALIINIEKLIMPIFGYLHIALNYDEIHETKIIKLSASATIKGFIIKKLNTSVPVYLPHIQSYEIQGGTLYIQDMFHLFRLAFDFKNPLSYLNNTTPISTEQIEITPKKSEELTIRIKELKRVDGELIHTKKFDSGDDTRRIIWKIFAKHKTLLVKSPELFNPFANELFIYASFYAPYLVTHPSDYDLHLLDYYKQQISNIVSTMEENNMPIRLITDQGNAIDTNNHHKIITSKWQANILLQDIVRPKFSNIICIQGFNAIEDIKVVLNNITPKDLVFFIKVSHAFKKNIFFNVLEKILLQSPSDTFKNLRTRWWFSIAKHETLKNEHAIENLLQGQNINYTQL